MAIRVEVQKVPASGAGAKDAPNIAWEHYESMRFLERFLKPRQIISSNQLRSKQADVEEKRPESEKFAKKRKAIKDKYDEEYDETNKLFAIAIKHLTNDVPVKLEEKQEKDGFLQAVLDSYDALNEENKFDGFLLAMSEIKKLRIG